MADLNPSQSPGEPGAAAVAGTDGPADPSADDAQAGESSWKKAALLLHPFLFAVVPILFLYAHNVELVEPRSLWVPLILALALAVGTFAALFLLTRNTSRAAIATTVLLVGFFFYGHVIRWLTPANPLHVLVAWHLYLPLWLLIFGGLAFVALRMRSHVQETTRILNAIAVIFLVVALLPLGAAATQDRGPAPEPQIVESASMPEEPRDVYHIVLDGYSRADVLEEYFQYNNSAFVENLRSKGFFVADEAHSNYVQTSASLPSMLNMQYLDAVTAQDQDTTDIRRDLAAIGQDNAVRATFESIGYETINVGASFWGFTRHNPHAEVNLDCGRMDEFAMVLVGTTMVQAVQDWVLPHEFRDRVHCGFERLSQVAEMPEPTYAFVHFISPHAPYVFDAEGNGVNPGQYDISSTSGAKAYVEQLRYINTQVEALVDDLLSAPGPEPIIVIHSDHGQPSGPASRRFLFQANALDDALEAEEKPQEFLEFLDQRAGVLNAMYLPGEPAVEPVQNMSLVNEFRFVFDAYYGADMGMLEHRVYASAYERPFDWHDVTQWVE